MKRICITTFIPDRTPQQVWDQFDENLFEKLNPPWVSARLLRFDGNKVGDEVHLEINFILFKQKWISEIVSNDSRDGHYEFVDEGKALPFFLKYWRHCHVITHNEGGVDLIDDIQFSTGTLIGDLLLYPALLAQFWYRKPVYKKYLMKTVFNQD